MIKNIFIVLEGFDGVGKTTTALALAELIKTKQHPVKLTFEPGATSLGGAVRKVLRYNPNFPPKVKLQLLLADRIEHYKKIIKPNLIKETSKPLIIICDRYFYSTFAYQGFYEGIEPETIFNWHHYNALFENLPDLVVYLNPGAEVIKDRLQIKNANKASKSAYERSELNHIDLMLDSYEKTFEFLKSKKQDFLIRRIEEIKTPQETAKEIWKTIQFILREKKQAERGERFYEHHTMGEKHYDYKKGAIEYINKSEILIKRFDKLQAKFGKDPKLEDFKELEKWTDKMFKLISDEIDFLERSREIMKNKTWYFTKSS